MNVADDQVYSADSVWQNPGRFLSDFVRDIRQCPDLGWQLFQRNLRARYRQSITGYVWAFIPPLAWVGLFLVLRGAGVRGNGSDIVYAAWVAVGVVFWQVFFESAQTVLRTFGEARSLLNKLKFPRESLLLAAGLEVGLQFLVRLPILLIAWWLSPDATAASWWLLPAGLLGLVAGGLCVGLVLLPLSLLYQDVAPALALIGGFWLLVTPVGFAPPAAGPLARLISFNPATPLITSARAWWLGGTPAATDSFCLVVGSTLLLMVLGWLGVRVAFPHLIARIGT